MRKNMTWHKKEPPKRVRWVQLAVVGALLAGFALFALLLFGLPYGTVIERSEEPESQESTLYREGRSQARVDWGE